MAIDLNFLEVAVNTSITAIKNIAAIKKTGNYNPGFLTQKQANPTEVAHALNQLGHLSQTISEVAAGRYNRPTHKI